jgi:hypothetical protein
MLPALKQRVPRAEQESLLKLYWNRAGVKRELSSLKRDHFELLDKLEQQENAIIRAQSQLEGLERLLTNPLAAANAMVYFQLRHLWRVAALKIEQFAHDLKQQREKRERAALHNTVLAKRKRRLEAINLKHDELQQKRRQTIEECERLEQRLDKMNVFMRLFAGPSLKTRIDGVMKNREALDERIAELNEAVEKIQAEPLPDPDGLSLDSRRMLNVAVIALAQELVLYFCEHNLARLAKKASQRTVGDMNFGDRGTCDLMVDRIRQRVDNLNSDKKLADLVKMRADALQAQSPYRHETDATPMREMLSEIPRSCLPTQAGDAAPPVAINVLEDDYWDLTNSLC